jgi:hypothetical protein
MLFAVLGRSVEVLLVSGLISVRRDQTIQTVKKYYAQSARCLFCKRRTRPVSL